MEWLDWWVQWTSRYQWYALGRALETNLCAPHRSQMCGAQTGFKVIEFVGRRLEYLKNEFWISTSSNLFFLQRSWDCWKGPRWLLCGLTVCHLSLDWMIRCQGWNIYQCYWTQTFRHHSLKANQFQWMALGWSQIVWTRFVWIDCFSKLVKS